MSDNAAWLNLDPTSGSSSGQPNTVTASVNISGLNAGTYNAVITVTAEGASNSPLTLPVTLTITGPKLSYSPQTFAFSGTTPQNPPSQTLTLTNSGGGTLNWSINSSHSWLTASPTSGSLTIGQSATATITIHTINLPPGTHLGSLTINISGAGQGPVTVPVTVQVSPGPVLSISQNVLSFEATVGEPAPDAQTITLSNAGGSALNWSASSNVPWLTVSPTSGVVTTGTAEITVAVNTTGLNAGTHNGVITITAPGAAGSPASIPVTLSLAPRPGPSGAQALKAASVTTLERLLGTSRTAPRIECGDHKLKPYWEKEIKDAIRFIKASLEPRLWVDDTHLNQRTGERVFDAERYAAAQLRHVIAHPHAPAEVKNVARTVRDSLVQACLL
ncbi:MAG: hypothetical protein N3E40_06810, partial [Dehalococcoidia bacterium]|nr:hypothetical protein [Dehalococcoidia bacterium]